jgi:hypothetical protein
MTTKTWNGSVADWYADSGGNWSPPGDPGSGDAVVINSGEAELLILLSHKPEPQPHFADSSSVSL